MAESAKYGDGYGEICLVGQRIPWSFFALKLDKRPIGTVDFLGVAVLALLFCREIIIEGRRHIAQTKKGEEKWKEKLR